MDDQAKRIAQLELDNLKLEQALAQANMLLSQFRLQALGPMIADKQKAVNEWPTPADQSTP